MLEGVLLFIFGVCLALYSVSLHDGGSAALSPALFPFILSVFVSLCGAGLALLERGKARGIRARRLGPNTGAGARVVLAAAILFALYIFLLPVLHFIAATFLFLSVFIFLAGERNPLPILAYSALFTASAFLVFGEGLSVALP